MNNISEELPLLLLDLNRKRRLIASARGIPDGISGKDLNLVEGTILDALVLRGGEMSIQTLAAHVRLDQSWVSRGVDSLSERLLVRTNRAKDDARVRLTQVLPAGERALELLDSELRAVSTKLIGNLSKKDQSLLTEFLYRLAQATEDQRVRRKQAGALDEALHFVSLRFGFFGKSAFASNHSLTELQLFRLLHIHASLPLSKLVQEMPLEQSTVSRLVTNLVGRNLLQKKPSQTDNRAYLIVLTQNGKAAFESVRHSAAEEIGQILKPLPVFEIRQGVEILQRITQANSKASESKESQLELISLQQLSRSPDALALQTQAAELCGFLKKSSALVPTYAVVRNQDIQAIILVSVKDILGHVVIFRHSLDPKERKKTLSMCNRCLDRANSSE